MFRGRQKYGEKDPSPPPENLCMGFLRVSSAKLRIQFLKMGRALAPARKETAGVRYGSKPTWPPWIAPSSSLLLSSLELSDTQVYEP